MLSVDGATTMMPMPNSTPLKRSVGSEPPKRGREGQKPDAHHAVQVRRYDALMVIPFSCDETSATECAFVTRAFYKGKAVDQLQLHLRNLPDMEELLDSHSETFATLASSYERRLLKSKENGYRFIAVCFDEQGNIVTPESICSIVDTGCTFSTFAIVKPALGNTRVDIESVWYERVR